MNKSTEPSLWSVLENITGSLKYCRLADVFRFVSFQPSETFGIHKHLRIEINYVKKGSCSLHLDNESVNFREGEIMIITPEVNHLFKAGSEGATLMQLEFLPEIFSHFDLKADSELSDFMPAFLFSEENKVIKIVNNIRIMRVIQRIVTELEHQEPYYKYLVLMYYAELFILIYRYADETFLPTCTHQTLKKAIGYIRLNYQQNINISDIAQQAGISERYLRKLFSQYVNLSPSDYVNQIRINKAMELLKNTELSVKEISFLCGFQSPQYFSRVFKQHIGLSPRQITK